jgi:hypothetical protein
MATNTNIYLGRPGALEIIYAPKGNIERTRVRLVDVFGLGGGGYRVSKQLGGARRYQIDYTRLTYETFKTLEAYDQGHNGVGPFVFLDPSQRNILTPNQSSATSERNDTNNFTVSGSGATIASSSTVYRRGPRSLAMTFQFAGTTGGVACDTPALDWIGFPLVTGRNMCFSAWVLGGGTDGVMTVRATIRVYDITGTLLTTYVDLTTVVTNTSTWQQVSVQAYSPTAGQVWAIPRLEVISGVNAGDIIYMDQLNFHEGTTNDTTWSPGTGILPVSVVSLADAWPITAPTYREKPTLILQEVGNGG